MIALRCPSCGSSCYQSIEKCLYCGSHMASNEILGDGRAAAAPLPPVPPGWLRYTDAWAGVSLIYPENFRIVRRQQILGVTDGAATPSTAVLWPQRVDGPVSLKELASHYVALVRRENPTFEAWEVPETPAAPDRLLMRTRAQCAGTTLEGSAAITLVGSSALLSAFSVPQATAPQRAADMIQVIRSFRTIPRLEASVFTEPMQGAFTALVPAGWSAAGEAPPSPTGGMAYQKFHCAADPAGLTLVAIESVRHWIFNESRLLGFMSLGLTKTQPYMPAPEFALQWLAPQMKQANPGLTVLGVEECPDMLPSLYESSAYIGQTPQEANYTTACLTTRYAMGPTTVRERTYVYVSRPRGPVAARYGMSSSWLAFMPAICRAPEADFACAEPVLDGIRMSFRISDSWRRRELARMDGMSQRLAMDSSARLSQISHTLSQTTDIITSSYWERQKTYDHVFHQQSLVTMGTTDVADSSGNVYNVPNNYDHYWRDDAGYVYGGSWATPPDPTWHKLEPVRI